MGELIGYRNRVQHATAWVRPKSARALLVRKLREDFGQGARAAEEMAEESLQWMRNVQGITLPGCVRLSVPATASRRYAPTRRMTVTVTAVDVDEDSEVWAEHGLAAMQRRRLWRWIYEIYRQGGYASLTELAAWANLTPTALEHRLQPLRDAGIWLPHVGGPAPSEDRLAMEPWLVRRFLERGDIPQLRSLVGIGEGAYRRALRRFSQLVWSPAGTDAVAGLSEVETEQMLQVARWARESGHGHNLEQRLRQAIGQQVRASTANLTPLEGQSYLQWLGSTVEMLGLMSLGESEMVFFALSSDEGAGARLRSARIAPIRLRFFTEEDALSGYRGESRRRVFELKLGRIRRYANEAWRQGALLSLPDLALLMGMHTAAVRRKISAHEDSFIPTRGRVWNIGARPARRHFALAQKASVS